MGQVSPSFGRDCLSIWPTITSGSEHSDFFYDRFSKALHACDKQIPLRNLLHGASFYARRADWRVDVIAASLTGYLFRRFPHDAFTSLYTDYRPPTAERPVIDLSGLLQRSLGISSFDELETNWIRYLQHEVTYHHAAYSKVKETTFSSVDRGNVHCQFCYTPVAGKKRVCPVCKQENSVDVKIV